MMFLPLFALAAAAGQGLPADPMAPAREGMMQCISPDVATRTCNSLASFAPATGGYTATNTVLLSNPAPPLP